MHTGRTWTPAKCIGYDNTPRSYILKSEGRTYRRNRRDILKTRENFCDEQFYQHPYAYTNIPEAPTPSSVLNETLPRERETNQQEPLPMKTKVTSKDTSRSLTMDTSISKELTPNDKSEQKTSRVSGRAIIKPKRYEN